MACLCLGTVASRLAVGTGTPGPRTSGEDCGTVAQTAGGQHVAIGFQGADPAQLRRLGAQMGSSGRTLLAQLGTLGAGVAQAPWPGPDAERFRHDWQSSHSRALRYAAAFLAAAGEELVRNAAEQEQASQARGAGTSGHGHPGAPATPQPADLEGKTPAQIRSWWDGLAAEQRTAFIAEHPVLAGNTNGIPFEDRVRANAINAQHRIDWLRSSDPEPEFNPLIMAAGYPAMYAKEHEAWAARQAGKDYLQSVADGKVKLAAYDPAHSAIVEMVGDYDADTTTVVTYVPGTLTNEQSFSGGGPQSVAKWLVDSDPANGTVAFVYKGTEFPDGAFAEAFFDEAKSDDFVAAAAPVLRDFQAAVELEKPAGAQTVAIGHSWGLRNVTGSEVAGARYDKVIALSGAAMPPGWTADPGTRYSSYTYPDILLTAERSGVVGDNYPMKEPAFEKHVYTPPGGSNWQEAYSIDNHSLIATTDPVNGRALADVRNEIRAR